MTFALLSLLGLAAGFGGLAWGWREKFREADDRRESMHYVYGLTMSAELASVNTEAELSRLPARIAFYTDELRRAEEQILFALQRLRQRTDGR